jgi:thymidylate synthase (FAD)
MEVNMKTIKPGYIIETDTNKKELLKQIEKIGRTCYKSENKITEESAEKFVSSLIKNGHEAVIEHYSITVRFICDRGITHEIVRHRMASYAQESTRYCNYSNDKFGNEINVIDIAGGIQLDTKMNNLSPEIIDAIINEWLNAMKDAEEHYMKMLELGSTAQIARSVLPTSVKTEIVVTINLREWRHFFNLRAHISAHPQMRELAVPLLDEFKTFIPRIFDDIQF